jgi:hypothetical protein
LVFNSLEWGESVIARLITYTTILLDSPECGGSLILRAVFTDAWSSCSGTGKVCVSTSNTDSAVVLNAPVAMQSAFFCDYLKGGVEAYGRER